jgi:hypothetical protein|tara:strand:- start:218 stop:442 length:225 start_codon:yes stop_codon:yes gene_type:complete
LVFYQEEVNLLKGIKELLSNEDMITLALIHKAKKGDVNAYKTLMDSAYGGVKQNIEITEAETPIFKQLDIYVIE